MEIKKATITVKRERGNERKEKGRKIEIEITDCNDSVIWQHSQQPYGNSKKKILKLKKPL